MKGLQALLVAVACVLPDAGSAADFPSRPIRIIVPFTPASAADLLARIFGPELTKSFGQQIVIDNRPSAGGTVAGGIVATAAPDGHTLMLTSSAFAGAAALYDKLPYDPIKDFAGISLITTTSLVLVVSANTGVKSVKELIALARDKKGTLNYGSAGVGSGTHYAGELFLMSAGVRANHVPYRGTPESITDIVSGRIDFGMTPPLSALPQIRAGRLLPVGVTSPQRFPMLPEIPTIGESAIPGFVYEGWFGVLAPARTPRALVGRLNAELVRIVALQETQDRIARDGSIAKSSTPEGFDKIIQDEIRTRTKVFKAAGAKTF